MLSHVHELSLVSRSQFQLRMKILVSTDISVLKFYGNIRDISMYIFIKISVIKNYSKLKIYLSYISKLFWKHRE